MKLKSKKILAASLASAVCFSIAGTTTANAIQIDYKFDITDSVNNGTKQYTKLSGNYEQGVRFKVRSIANPLHKDWWQLKLVVKDGKLQLQGPTNIPSHLTIDDDYTIRVYDPSQNLKAVYKLDYRKKASEEFRKLVESFNKYAPTYKDCYIVIAGKTWRDTVKFYSKENPNQSAITSTSGNDFRNGYQNVSKNRTAFKITDRGLVESYLLWDWYWDF